MLKRVNNIKIKPIPQYGGETDTRPLRGAEIFPEYSNVFIPAKKRSGKTWTVYNIIDMCADKETKVLAFCSTLYKDKGWINIRKHCKAKGIEFEGHTSIYDEDGENLVKKFVEENMGEEENDSDEEDNLQNQIDKVLERYVLNGGYTVPKKKKSKYKPLEYIIIFDDLSDEIKDPVIATIMKKNRHYKAHILVSTQYYKDIFPSARKNVDIALVFGGFPEDILQGIYKDTSQNMPFDKFVKIYNFATSKRYNFLYISTIDDSFRKNFDLEINPEHIK